MTIRWLKWAAHRGVIVRTMAFPAFYARYYVEMRARHNRRDSSYFARDYAWLMCRLGYEGIRRVS